MNGQHNPTMGVPKIGGKPKIKILKETDEKKFEKEFDALVVKGWQSSGINHSVFYDQEKHKVVISFLCIFQRIS